MQYYNTLFMNINNFSEPCQLQINEKLTGMTVEKLKILRPADALIMKEVEVKLQTNLTFFAKPYLSIGVSTSSFYES